MPKYMIFGQTRNLTTTNWSYERFVPELFPGVDIGKMNFNCWNPHGNDASRNAMLVWV